MVLYLPNDSILILSRPYWRCYFPNTSAIIYVIDSADHARIGTSRTELLTMLAEEELKGVPLLVFCNKQDIEGALKPEDISEQLGLAGGEKTRPWSVRGSSAKKGEGLEEGLDWYVVKCLIVSIGSFSFSKACACYSAEVMLNRISPLITSL